MVRFASIRRFGIPAGLALLVAQAGQAPALAQCALCGEAAGAGDVGRGLSISILFLLVTLGLLAAGLLLLAARAARRDADRAPGGEEKPLRVGGATPLTSADPR
jgi:hypothetical protein